MSKFNATSFAAWLSGREDDSGPYAEFRVNVPMPELAAHRPHGDEPAGGASPTYDRATSACFSPDGARILTAHDDGTARLWDGVTGQELLVLHGHRGAIRSACFSPDGTRILTAGVDGTARLWNPETGEGRVLAGLDRRAEEAAGRQSRETLIVG